VITRNHHANTTPRLSPKWLSPTHPALLAAIAIGFLAPISSTRADSLYSITDLGVLRGNSSDISVTGLNDNGQVVGYAENTNGIIRAFLWNGGTVTDLGTLGGPGASAFGINNAGQIVGQADVPGGDAHAFIYSNGIMTDLNLPGAGGIRAQGINQRGDVCGYFFPPGSAPYYHAFLYTAGVVVDLGPLPGGDTFSGAGGVNSSGQVIGLSRPSFQAVLWNPDIPNSTNYTIQTLAPTRSSNPYSINELGQIVGAGQYRGTDGIYYPFLYSGGKVAEFDGTDILVGGAAISINNCGQIVGGLTDSFGGPGTSFHAFTYDPANSVRDLNTLIPTNSNWVLSEADAVNSAGQIAGYGVTNGETHVFLLTPNAEPDLQFNQPAQANGQIQLSFAGPANLSSFTLLQASTPGGPWTTNSSILLTNVSCGCFTVSNSAPAAFFRLQSP
jgi:probable HAF family extracellular repeat protein